MSVRRGQTERFERCVADGGVALFPSDTVYGLACDPGNRAAIARLYGLKQRPPAKASAVMFFELDAALATLLAFGPRTRTAINYLMPGGVTLLLPNPERLFPLACGDDPDTLGLRVVSVPELAGARVPVMQSSANIADRPAARRLEDVPEALRTAVDLVVDGGELPGTASTVVDLRGYERGEGWRVIRSGAVEGAELAAALGDQFHFHPDTYQEMIQQDIPGYEEFQDAVVVACGEQGARRILELGTGTGETALRLLERFGESRLVGVDESQAMLAEATRRLPGERVELRLGRLQDPLPEGAFDLVASALCVHHLAPDEKADLFARVRRALGPGGRFVLGDCVLPVDPDAPMISLTPGYDKPSSVADQLRWLIDAGFSAELVWERGSLAVIVADPSEREQVSAWRA